MTNTYGYKWDGTQEGLLAIELEMVRKNYFRKDYSVLTHYLSIHRILWPEDDQHRWFVLGMRSIVENKISVFLGSASSGKSYLMSVHALITFWCFPKTSLALISSTDKRSLEQKIWGRGIKTLFNRAKTRFQWLSGYILESSMAIATDDVDEEGEFGRLLNTGIACVPCVSGGRFVGMSKYQGIKPPDSPGKHDGLLTHYGDETAVMHTAYADAYTNWTVNDNFKGVQSGNPTDITDPLCTAAEPVGGWDSFEDTGKTQEWNSRWYNAHVIAFDGRDTPNNDQPGTKYPFLISRDFIQSLKETHGEDSWQLYQQGIGKPSRGMVSNRVITIGLCERNKAFEDVIWMGETLTKIYALDPAFGGGDRCVGTPMAFGPDKNDKIILDVGQPEIIPVRMSGSSDAEQQIAEYIFRRLGELGVKSTNCFYDSVGRGTLGNAFAKLFKDECPIPVDSGQKATDRPVRFDLFVEEKGRKRLKRCNEHYSKFITEAWFSTREAIESQQIRNLPMITAQEGQLRMFSIVSGNRIEVESKDDMKERIKKSPDLYDSFAIGVEGARRLGFKIERIGLDSTKKTPKDSWLTKSQEGYKELLKSKELVRA